MKRTFAALLLTVAAAFALAAPAMADVIWTPDDSFYEAHYDECDYEGRTYLLDGYGGEVELWNAPRNGRVVKRVENGRRGTIQFIWHGDGLDWGYLCFVEDSGAEGWVPMDDLSLIYDSQQFMEDHEQALVEGEPVPVSFSQAVLYDYPGGPAGYVLEESKEYQPFSQVFTTIYTDEDGLRWGYVNYYMGRRQRWVCLDDPMNENLDTAVVQTPASPAQLRGTPTVTGQGMGQTMLIAAGLVAAVVALTAVLIRRIRPKTRMD